MKWNRNQLAESETTRKGNELNARIIHKNPLLNHKIFYYISIMTITNSKLCLFSYQKIKDQKNAMKEAKITERK